MTYTSETLHTLEYLGAHLLIAWAMYGVLCRAKVATHKRWGWNRDIVWYETDAFVCAMTWPTYFVLALLTWIFTALSRMKYLKYLLLHNTAYAIVDYIMREKPKKKHFAGGDDIKRQCLDQVRKQAVRVATAARDHIDIEAEKEVEELCARSL